MQVCVCVCVRALSILKEEIVHGLPPHWPHLSSSPTTLLSQVEVVTTDLRGAGTDSNVTMVMHGTLGDGKRHTLTSGPDDFDR